MLSEYKALAIGTACCLLLTLLSYYQWGSWRDYKIYLFQKELNNIIQVKDDKSKSLYTEKRVNLIQQLQQRIKADPKQVKYWVLLGDLLMEAQQYETAALHYRRAGLLAADAIDIKVRLIEAEFIANQYRLSPELSKLIEEALATDPRQQTQQSAVLLGIKGLDAYRHQKVAEAVAYWQQALKILPETHPTARFLRAQIALARPTDNN